MNFANFSGIKAVWMALSGMVTVFMILFLLILLIQLVSKIATVMDKKPLLVDPDLVSESEHTEQVYRGEIQLLDVDEKTAACLMAIISEETGIPLSQLVFKKIRLLDGGLEI